MAPAGSGTAAPGSGKKTPAGRHQGQRGCSPPQRPPGIRENAAQPGRSATTVATPEVLRILPRRSPAKNRRLQPDPDGSRPQPGTNHRPCGRTGCPARRTGSAATEPAAGAGTAQGNAGATGCIPAKQRRPGQTAAGQPEQSGKSIES